MNVTVECDLVNRKKHNNYIARKAVKKVLGLCDIDYLLRYALFENLCI